jgi:hypothetical protein
LTVRSAPRRRLATFLAASLILVVAALATSRLHPRLGPAGPSPSLSRPDPALALASRLRLRLRRTARRFLAAYLRYEVGERGPLVRRGIRCCATPRFARLLLANPPRSAASQRSLAPARLRGLEVSFQPTRPGLAFVGGVALRGVRREPFSFQFSYTAAGWRASGIGE